MKLYLAGNPGHGTVGKWREEMIKRHKARRLWSFFWARKDFLKYFEMWTKERSNDD